MTPFRLFNTSVTSPVLSLAICLHRLTIRVLLDQPTVLLILQVFGCLDNIRR